MPETTRFRFYRTEAIILKQMSIGDADRILTFITPGMGKLRAVAKGVRRVRSKLAGHVEVLNHVRLSLAQGRNLDVVSQADSIHGFRGIRDNLDALSRALYFADLVDNFTVEESRVHSVYSLLLESLGWLEKDEFHELTPRYFEMKLLACSGYLPEMYKCVHCRSELMPADHLFSVALGGIICPNCQLLSQSQLVPVSLNAVKVLRHLQREEYPKAVQLKMSPALAGELERILRANINHLLEREVKSASFVGLIASPRGNG